MDEQAKKIGEAAGLLWSALEGKAEGLNLTQLKTKTGLGAELLNQAVGWLAREDKVEIEEKNRVRVVYLKSS
jgi:hypothetical protein